MGAVLLCACSSTSGSSGSPQQDAGSTQNDAGGGDASGGIATEHGQLVDYFTQKPVAGLTVTDNGVTATTDMNGNWSLQVPYGSTLTPVVTGPKYTNLLFPASVPSAPDVDFGQAVIPDISTYSLEQQSVTNDPTLALVQIVVVPTGSCTSVVGGTLAVTSPPGTQMNYFSTTAIPDPGSTSFQAVKGQRPVAVVFNIAIGSDLAVQITHPTCKQVPFPATYNGKTYTGKVPTKPAEPGDNNAALVVLMQ